MSRRHIPSFAGYLSVLPLITALCQAVDNPRPIELEKTITTQLLAPGRYSHFRCDSDSNVYLRVYEGGRLSPVVRVSADGKTTTTFSLPSTHDLTAIQDFWVASNGEVSVLGEKAPDEGYILFFDADGQYRNAVRLEVPIRPNQIAVFPSGDLLVAGREPSHHEPHKSLANSSPFVGIFNSRGQLLKRIQLRKDVKPRPKQPGRADLKYAETVVGSTTESDGSGNVYFIRKAADGPVYAVSPSGVIAKTIRLSPPKGAVLSTVKVAGDRLAAEFFRNTADDSQVESVITQIVDLGSSKKLAEYSSVPPLGPDFACYQPDSFTFLFTDNNGYLTLLEATGR
jgi:hypothetical protein